jgi:virginiamycin B lyase
MLSCLAATAAVVCASASAAEPPTVDINGAGATKLSITGDWLTAGGGAVWLSGQNALYRLDATTGQVSATILVPEPCEATDFGFNAVWTASCGRSPGLARINAVTNRVNGFVRLAIPRQHGGEASVGVGSGAVWIVVDGRTCFACVLARVKPRPRSLKVVARIRLRAGAAGVRVGQGAVWVTNPSLDLVQKINPARNRVVATTKVGKGPRFFAVGEGGVWILNQRDGSITRLDPATGAVVTTIEAGVLGDGGDMTAGGGWVWARGTDILLTQIDPRTNTVVKRYGPSSGSGAAIVAFDAVWISAHDVSTVWRLPLPKP